VSAIGQHIKLYKLAVTSKVWRIFFFNIWKCIFHVRVMFARALIYFFHIVNIVLCVDPHLIPPARPLQSVWPVWFTVLCFSRANL
jgi:hypothetical protein